jgi:hypothetical protein
VKGELLSSTSVYSSFTCENITIDKDIKEYESIDIHVVRNRNTERYVKKQKVTNLFLTTRKVPIAIN